MDTAYEVATMLEYIHPISIDTHEDLIEFRAVILDEIRSLDISLMDSHMYYVDRVMGLASFRRFAYALYETVDSSQFTRKRYLKYAASYYVNFLVAFMSRGFVETLMDYAQESTTYLWFITEQLYLDFLNGAVVEKRVDIQKTMLSVIITGFCLEFTPTTTSTSMVRWLSLIHTDEEMIKSLISKISANITERTNTIH